MPLRGGGATGQSAEVPDTDAEAHRLFTSLQQGWINLRRGRPGPLLPPVESMDGHWTEMERAQVEHGLRMAVVGSPESVQSGIRVFLEATQVDEIIVTGQIYDHRARLRSFEIVASVREAMARAEAKASAA